ncbi:PAS domain-containing protein, partial [Acinetobacter baumannii]
FWAHLRAGEYQRAEFRRLGKGGAEIWLRASYNPVRGRRGAPARVLTFATDVTQQKLRNAEVSSQLEAISRSQGVAEFT